jgi:hypothetical protein
MPSKLLAEPQTCSPQEFAALSGLSLSSVWRRIADGSLPCDQPGGPRHRRLIPIFALTGIFQSEKQPSVSYAENTAKATKGKLPGPKPNWMK